MSIRLRAPLRGLLTGVFVLLAFAFTAVSMTAGGSRSVIDGLPRPLTAQVVPAATPTADAATAAAATGATPAAAANTTSAAASRMASARAGDETHGRGDRGHHR